jgi:hypothetical protein
MFKLFSRSTLFLAVQLSVLVLTTPVQAQLDPSILSNLAYDRLQWFEDRSNPGSWYTVLSGNPARPGRFVILNKVLRGNFNRPHSHPYEREIYVVSGTWWVGTGRDRNIARAEPMRPGAYVRHRANRVHWDGAKDEDVLLLIAGQGPAITDYAR